MKCNKCGKNVSQPLELFDGRVVCSECGKDFLAADSTFVITEENQAYFNRSEELYLDWLSRQDSDVEHSSVDKAVELCKASAYLGNPEALARLGYYYDFDYEEANRGENMRTRLAYRCYRAVCMQQIAPKVESNAREIDFIELQKRTAKLLLSMMDKASDEVKKELENDYAVVKNSIASRLGVDIKKRADEVEFNEVKFALDHIAHIVSDQRGTLIGMLKISKSTLVELIQPQNNGVTNLLDLVQKSNKIRMFLVDLTSR
ncbi:MAG: hypothetical protein IKC64_05815, partial [Clostridia bacterium]|nr:hypothetical protein [Clostridia bacterium]